LTQQCLVGKMLPSWVMAFFFSFFSDGKRRHECASFFIEKKLRESDSNVRGHQPKFCLLKVHVPVLIYKFCTSDPIQNIQS
jgi:hypothetical protein